MTAASLKPALTEHPAGTLALSGEALLDLMKAVLERDLAFRFEARGTSMAPFIRSGDIVTIQPLRDRCLSKGDVVAFTEPLTEKLYVHRIIKKTASRYAVKGDNVSLPDGVIPATRILGVVSKVERKGREVSLGVERGRALIAGMSRVGVLPFAPWGAARAFLRIFHWRRTK